jgi:hypothetical protein
MILDLRPGGRRRATGAAGARVRRGRLRQNVLGLGSPWSRPLDPPAVAPVAVVVAKASTRATRRCKSAVLPAVLPRALSCPPGPSAPPQTPCPVGVRVRKSLSRRTPPGNCGLLLKEALGRRKGQRVEAVTYMSQCPAGLRSSSTGKPSSRPGQARPALCCRGGSSSYAVLHLLAGAAASPSRTF